MLLTILLILLLVALIATLPRWEYSRGYGYTPATVIAVVLVILIILMLAGAIPGWRAY